MCLPSRVRLEGVVTSARNQPIVGRMGSDPPDRCDVRSQRRHRYSRHVVSAHFSLAPKSRFPETETARGRDSVRMPITPKEVEHLVLPRPHRGHVGEAGHSHAMRQPPRDGRSHEIGRHEGKRDRHIDLAGAAAGSGRDAFRVRRRVRDELTEPATPSCD